MDKKIEKHVLLDSVVADNGGDVEDADMEVTFDVASEPEKPNPSVLQLCAYNAYAFVYGQIIATMGLLILPLESSRLFPEKHGLMLGAMLFACGTTQLVCPVAGYISDRSLSKYGKRRVFMVTGAVVTGIGAVGMDISSRNLWGYSFLAWLTIGNLGMNIGYAGYTALLPDIVPKDQMGSASGVMAVLYSMGSMSGTIILGLWWDMSYAYLLYGVSINLAVVVTSIVAKEEQQKSAAPVLKSEILACYVITEKTHGDFFWVFVIRFFYYMSVSIQSFGVYYLDDVTGVPDPKRSEAILACFVILATMIAAVPAGKAADRIGRKKLLYGSCAMMTVVYIAMLLAPPVNVFYAVGFIYGLGNGVFLTCDYALACDVLPDPENAAKDLGLWGIAAFLGTTVSPAIAGPLLHFFGATETKQEGGGKPDVGDEQEHYGYGGYNAIFLLGVMYVLMAAWLLRKVKGSR